MVRIAPPAIGTRSILAFIFLARIIMLLMPNPPSRLPLKLLNARKKNLVEKGFLEVSDNIYTLRFHDAGQTGHEPDN